MHKKARKIPQGVSLFVHTVHMNGEDCGKLNTHVTLKVCGPRRARLCFVKEGRNLNLYVKYINF